MPLVTLTVTAPKTTAFKHAALDGVHQALIKSGVPAADRFQRVLELSQDDFRFDPRYPDLARNRDGEFVVIEILWSVGRSVKVKRQVVADIMAALAENPGLDSEHVMLVFKETTWENWSFGGGRLIHV